MQSIPEQALAHPIAPPTRPALSSMLPQPAPPLAQPPLPSGPSRLARPSTLVASSRPPIASTPSAQGVTPPAAYFSPLLAGPDTIPSISQSRELPVPCTPSVIPEPTSTHHMITRQRDNTRKKCKFPDHVTLLATKHPLPLSLIDEPTSFTSANKIPEWRDAMTKELTALAQNKTWVLVPPCDQNVIGCK